MKTVTRATRWLPLAVLLAAIAVPSQAEAQRRRDGEPPNREEIEQRIRAQMGRMMQERLGLDESQAESLSEVVGSFDGQRRELIQREFDTRRRVDALLDRNGNDEEARALLEQQAELRMQEAELFRDEQEALLEILSPAQVLELQDLREDIGRRIRALRGRGGSDDGRFRGPGPDRPRRDGPRPGPDGRLGMHGVPPGPPPIS